VRSMSSRTKLFAVTVTLVLASLAGMARAGAATAVAFGPVFQLTNPSNPDVFLVFEGEPSVRTDGLGNVFVASIRGVPAGVDVWRIGAPYTSTSQTYLGSPDGLPKIPGGGPSGGDEDTGVATGGGDTELATNCSTNQLNVNSLNIATTENFISSDQGATFLQTEPSSSIYSGADDREWYDTDGPTVVYQSVHDTALGNDDVVTKSLDGGLTWLPVPGKVFNPAQPDAYASAMPLNNKLATIVVDQHRHILYQVYSAGATPEDNVNGVSLRAVWIAVSKDGGLTWADHRIYADASPSMRTDDVFPAAAVDDAGNVYAAWSLIDSSDPTNHPGTFFSSSTDQGTTWTKPVKVNQGAQQNLTLFPWMDAAGDGGVDLVYFGTSANTNGGDAVWNVFMAQSLNAHASLPTFTTTQITGVNGLDPIHFGNVSTGGLQPGGSSDRSLADLFQVSIDQSGLANISWSADWFNRANPGDTFDSRAWFVHQTAGAIPGRPNDGCHSFNGGPVGAAAELKAFGTGRIASASGGTAQFGFSVPLIGGQPALTVIDKNAGVQRFKADTFSPPTGAAGSASWTGTGTLTHADGSSETVAYLATAVDGGPRGRGDSFSISFGTYSNTGPLKAGDVTVN
jgi:hypothetical protein